MSIRKIYQYPDPVLRKQTETITVFDHELAALIEDMAETMYDAPGVGLAAPQIGMSSKLIVVDTTEGKEGEKKFMAMVNPEIVTHEGSQVDEEGCLSVPELTAISLMLTIASKREKRSMGELAWAVLIDPS